MKPMLRPRRPSVRAGLFVAVAAISCAVHAEQLELRGVAIGAATLADVKARFPGAQLAGSVAVVDAVGEVKARCGMALGVIATPCGIAALDDVRVGGGVPGKYYFDGKTGTVDLATVTFQRGGFAVAKAAVVGKYGPPTTSTQRSVQNRMGATFTGEELTWNVPEGRIQLEELAGRVDESRLTMYAPQAIERIARESARKSAEAPGKL